MDFSRLRNMLTGEQTLFIYPVVPANVCPIQWPRFYEAHFKSLSSEYMMYGPYVVVSLTNHRWDDKARSNQLRVAASLDSNPCKKPSGCFRVCLCLLSLKSSCLLSILKSTLKLFPQPPCTFKHCSVDTCNTAHNFQVPFSCCTTSVENRTCPCLSASWICNYINVAEKL